MTAVQIVIRDPFFPHSEIASVRPVGLQYGFMLHRPAKASFAIWRSDLNRVNAFDLGMLISIERSDKVLPWVGYVKERRLTGAGAMGTFEAEDIAGTLFSIAVTAKDWEKREDVASGFLITEVFGEAAARAEPPLQLDLPISGGPPVSYQVRSESLLSFLRTLEKWTNWEWGLEHQIASDRVRTKLIWTQRIGFDRVSEIFEEGSSVKAISFTQSARGYIARAVAVGGSGVFAVRDAETVSLSGKGYGNANAHVLGTSFSPKVASSPALQGTQVVVDTRVTNREAQLNAAVRLHAAPEEVREQLEMTLVESRIQMSKLELGSRYRVRFKDLGFGLGLQRVIRIVSLSLDLSGEVQVVAEVLQGRSDLEETRQE